MDSSNTENQLERKKGMKEVRGSRTIFSSEDYLNHRFANGDQKEELVGHLNGLRPALKGLEQLDNSTKQTSLKLGRRGLELLEALEEIKKSLKHGKFSIKNYISIHLGFNSSRFYEAVAMAKAVEAGASEDLNLTKLQILGAALNSVNENRMSLAISCITENKLPNGIKLNEAKVEEFMDAFRATKSDRDIFNFADLIKSIKKNTTTLKTFLEKRNFKEVQISEEMYSLKNELLVLRDLIEEFETRVSPKVQLH